MQRLVAGNVASWGNLLVNFVVQLVSAPVFLSFWEADTYAVWLLFIALSGLLQLLDTGHQNFLGNEFLRIGIEKKNQIQTLVSSGCFVALLLGLLALLCVFVGIFFSGLSAIIPSGSSNQKEVGLLLVAHSAVWMMTGSVGGLLVRLMSAYGYFSRYAWWGSALQLTSGFSPLLVVVLGGGLLGAGFGLLTVVAIINLLLLWDIVVRLRRENFRFCRPSLKVGFKNFGRSLWLSFKALLEMIRQHGMRIIIAPIISVSELASFATIRIGANVALKGLSTITLPLLPELMRFLRQREQEKSEAAFATVWFMVLGILTPAVILLQVWIEPVFLIWTRGKVAFDPALFALLSCGVLFFSAAQPAEAIVRGNNLLIHQFIISALCASLVLIIIFFTVEIYGIQAVGVALLVGELVSLVCNVLVASSWMRKAELRWPWKSFAWVISGLIIASVGLTFCLFYADRSISIAGFAIFILFGINFYYYRSVPPFIGEIARRSKSLFSSAIRG